MALRGSALERVFQLSQAPFSRELAAFILTLSFPLDDRRRYEELSRKAQEGLLNDDERADLEDLLTANDFLMILQSKARTVLSQKSPAA